MIIKIVCAGFSNFKKLYSNDKDEYIVSVDGGAKDIIELGLPIDLALGDFDSFDIEVVKKYTDNIVKYPSEKDYGDFELAIQQILKLNPDQILVYNVTGNRLDHFLATLNVLKKYYDLNIKIIDEKNIIYILNNTTKIEKNKYKYISFFSIFEDTVISLNGFKYNLVNYKLSIGDNLCLSNEITNEYGKIIINKPVLVIKSN